MDCLVLPVSILTRKRFTGSRLGYKPLKEDGLEGLVRVVVGKEKREFLVEDFVLKESPFRVLMDAVVRKENRGNRVIFVDVDAILFEHMLWLMYNDCSSLFQLNLEEILEFYAQDN
ncbi:hypothetical protein HS088_TW16G00729 [Tripterygium wilfordii]|uniref:Uncharacterized protein n=1 Tax=Tripterygium wilfordii TaxID=458696 RepID=A0A7J7CJP4_TRIWF|nr:auxin-responsive protein SAUR77-like [Tripterygium wilfordii]KAF5734282.1 hypothetical protein HS088_TW16G00729 [Tripterygium wilfordii]